MLWTRYKVDLYREVADEVEQRLQVAHFHFKAIFVQEAVIRAVSVVSQRFVLRHERRILQSFPFLIAEQADLPEENFQAQVTVYGQANVDG